MQLQDVTTKVGMVRSFNKSAANRECAFGLSVRGRGGSRLPECILRSSSGVK